MGGRPLDFGIGSPQAQAAAETDRHEHLMQHPTRKVFDWREYRRWLNPLVRRG